MSRQKVSTTVYLEPAQLVALKALSDRTRVPVAVYVRDGVDLVLAHHSTPATPGGKEGAE